MLEPIRFLWVWGKKSAGGILASRIWIYLAALYIKMCVLASRLAGNERRECATRFDRSASLYFDSASITTTCFWRRRRRWQGRRWWCKCARMFQGCAFSTIIHSCSFWLCSAQVSAAVIAGSVIGGLALLLLLLVLIVFLRRRRSPQTVKGRHVEMTEDIPSSDGPNKLPIEDPTEPSGSGQGPLSVRIANQA